MMLRFPLPISLLFCKRLSSNIHSQNYAVLFAGELTKEIDVVFSHFCQVTEAEKRQPSILFAYFNLLINAPLSHVFSAVSPFVLHFFGRFSVLKKPFLLLSYIKKTVLHRNKKNENWISHGWKELRKSVKHWTVTNIGCCTSDRTSCKSSLFSIWIQNLVEIVTIWLHLP